MIWLLMFFWVFMFSSKDFLFINSNIDFNSCCLMMVSISFPIYMLISLMCQATTEAAQTTLFKCSFLFSILLVSFTYFLVDPFFFLVCVEISVMPMSWMMLNLAKDSDKVGSLMLMIFINLFGSIPFMGFCAVNANPQCVFSPPEGGCLMGFSSTLLFVSFLLLLVSKIPIFMIHFWLTKAHVSASGATSMLLASLMLKLGTFGLIKFHKFFSVFNNQFLTFLFAWSATGALLITCIMIRSLDVKYLIACSSILHMSMIFPCSLLGSPSALIFSLFMSVCHGLVSFFLFMLVSLIYEGSINRTWEFNSSMESVSKNLPLFMFLYLILNLGFPPLLNFLAELLLCASLISYSFSCTSLFCISMILSVLFSMVYILKTLFGKNNKLLILPEASSLQLDGWIFLFFLLMVPFLL